MPYPLRWLIWKSQKPSRKLKNYDVPGWGKYKYQMSMWRANKPRRRRR